MAHGPVPSMAVVKTGLVYCLHRWGELQIMRRVFVGGEANEAYKRCERCGYRWDAFNPEPKVAIGEVGE